LVKAKASATADTLRVQLSNPDVFTAGPGPFHTLADSDSLSYGFTAGAPDYITTRMNRSGTYEVLGWTEHGGILGEELKTQLIVDNDPPSPRSPSDPSATISPPPLPSPASSKSASRSPIATSPPGSCSVYSPRAPG
jgi:hypothetical protein